MDKIHVSDEIPTIEEQQDATELLGVIMRRLGIWDKYSSGDADKIEPREWEEVAFLLAEAAIVMRQPCEKSNTTAVADTENWDGYFVVTRVHRNDLENIGFDISNVDDATMQRLADKMGDAYCSNSYWIDLEILAECLDIPKSGDSKLGDTDD